MSRCIAVVRLLQSLTKSDAPLPSSLLTYLDLHSAAGGAPVRPRRFRCYNFTRMGTPVKQQWLLKTYEFDT